MGQALDDDDELEAAIRACRAAAAKMSGKRPFRMRVLLNMLQGELDAERTARSHEPKNGHEDRSPDQH